ncbi:MAG: SH3 domain-containing protein [Clostridia bacterium]|nr:SH3 domain-containing protein [Clostridia bacterium]
MTKRLISLALIAVLTAMLIPSLAVADRIMYVYTDDGKSLNVRSSPNTGDNKIGSLKYGAQVDVISISNGWANIWWTQSEYGEFRTAYVQSRFLVNYQPGPKPVQPTPAPTSSPSTDYAKEFLAINKEFESAKQVAYPYTVVARPSRASGWVNLRWAPSTEAERISTCPQGKELTVLVEMKNWYQVQDPETGMIGFISSKYVTRK